MSDTNTDNALVRYENRLVRALPDSAEVAWAGHMVRYAARNPELLECAEGPTVAALMQGESLKLGLGVGYYVIARWNGKTRRKEPVFQIGYRGALQLARRGSRLTGLRCSLVYKREVDAALFHVRQHLSPGFEHTPILDARDGEPIAGAYCTYKVDGEWEGVKWMSVEQLKAHRSEHAPRNKAGEIVGPWAKPRSALQMMLKTTLTQGLKLAPLPDDAHHALIHDNTVIDLGTVQVDDDRRKAASGRAISSAIAAQLDGDAPQQGVNDVESASREPGEEG